MIILITAKRMKYRRSIRKASCFTYTSFLWRGIVKIVVQTKKIVEESKHLEIKYFSVI